MKKVLIAMTMALLSAQTFATCEIQALEVAQKSLDKQAVEYGFESSYIEKDSLKLSFYTYEGAVSYSIEGYIYKASYTIHTDFNSQCEVQSVRIEENL